jgi:hypothetical protein
MAGLELLMDFNVKECYNKLNESEKFGIQFGLFPVSLQGLNHDDIVELMKYDKYVRNYNALKEILEK